MTTPTRTRFDRIFKDKPKPQPPTNADEPAFWEKELAEPDRQRDTELSSEPVEDKDREVTIRKLEKGPSHAASKVNDVSKPGLYERSFQSSQQSKGQKDTLLPEEIMYLPNGRRSKDVSTTEPTAEDKYSELISEPASSSHEIHGRFCTFSQVVKFPYRFMHDPEDRVSRRFFAGGKIYQRNWDLYYLHGPAVSAFKPLILVPLHQVQTLVDDIGREFCVTVGIPAYPFQLSFYQDGTPKPKYIGRVNCKTDMTEMQSGIPNVSEDYERMISGAYTTQVQDYAAWNEKILLALESEKRKWLKRKTNQKQNLIATHALDSLRSAQRYLGLRPRLPTAEVLQNNAPSSSQPPRSMQEADGYINTLDVEQRAPFPFQDETIMISIDVESWEMDHNIITEIGVSTLDTADIKDVPLGDEGKGWLKRIRSRHFRIKGRERLVNFKFCHGYPDMFQFGFSEFITVDDAPNIVDSCFEQPYSASFECPGYRQGDEGVLLRATPATSDPTHILNGNDKSRTLVLIGHDLKGDTEYLSALGSEIFGSANCASSSEDIPSRRQRVLSSIRESFDTASLYKALRRDQNTRSLAKVCEDLNIDAPYVHNAGNDARYTLEAFIKLVIQSRQIEDQANTVVGKPENATIEKQSFKETRNENTIKAASKDMSDDDPTPY